MCLADLKMNHINFEKHNKSRKQSGSTLVEALVSLFVFAVGALGIAALQTTSVVRNDDTSARSAVIWKAQDLVDRMRSTKTVQNSTGRINDYLTAIDNGVNNIGTFNAANGSYQCPSTQPTSCDSQVCNADEMVTFDLWDVFCNPSSGLSATGGPQTGSSAIRSLEVALIQNGAEFQLYFEWLNRSAANSVDEDGVDTELGNGTRSVLTNLCGNVIPVDARLDAYCVRFQ